MSDSTPEPYEAGEVSGAEPGDPGVSGAYEAGEVSGAGPGDPGVPEAYEAGEVSGAGPRDPGVPGAYEAADAPAGAEAPGGASGAAEPSLRAGLEAILLVVDEPVPEVTLAQILERPREDVAGALRELAAEYTAQGRGFDLRAIAGGWRFYTRDVCAPLVERFVQDGQQARLTQAALETLAVVAYRQPVSRARVSAIRGVNSDGVIRTLTLRGLIEEAGHDPEHQAVLYRTTSYFLERLGLGSVDELPDLAPYLPDDLEGIEELQR